MRGKVRRAREYLTANAARLDYPAFVARQLPIGSGAVESAGKTVIQARTKGAGMRWSGAQAVVSLRTLHRSGRWDAFWQRRPPAPLPAPPPHTSAAPARYGGPRPRFRPAAPYRATSGPATTSRARSRSTAPSDPAATPPVVLWPRSRSA